MSDSIGRVVVPTPSPSGLVFPLKSDFGYGTVRPWPIITHQFGERQEKTTQRFLVGIGPRKFTFRRAKLSYADRATLFSFFEQVQGSYQTFTYHAPEADQTTTDYQVIFEQQPLTIDDLATSCHAGLNLIEQADPSGAPTYTVNSTVLRFPSSTLKTALLDQVQEIIPLVHIRVSESAVPDIYLSDRRCTVGGQLYLPRLLNIGEPGSDVIVSQDILGTADNVRFTFGNADRVMTALMNDTDLKFATIDLSLYHVNSGIVLQLWAGQIINCSTDGSAQFSVQCSDGLYQVTQQYPSRVISRYCWKPFNDGTNCPYSSVGSGGHPTLCSFSFSSPFVSGDPAQPGGCVEHHMSPASDGKSYHGGVPAQPQGVFLKDNSTGLFGFQRNRVTSVSIISDTMYGQPLPDIWCNSDGDPGKAFHANAIVADVRDEGDYTDVLGIVGAGELGQYTGMLVYQNADGFRYIIAPMADGFPPQGFKVDSHLTIRSQSDLGLREVLGTDPVDPAEPGGGSFSLGQGTPQVWGPQKAAGVAFVEIRYPKPSGFVASTTDQHSMTVPIDTGLIGFRWNSSGSTRTFAPGETNVFWVAINTYLRGLGLWSNTLPSDQLAKFVLSSLIVGDGSGTAEIADLSVPVLVGTGTETQFRFQGTIGQQKPLRDWLTEILAPGLGFFTWEFGKLKLGIRENASAVEAFTVGNILLQSLRLSLVDAAFEHLVIDFADRDYQYQANIAEYQDKSHAAYYKRSETPLTARMHSVGISTLSQGLRVATTRVREEIGGVVPYEWRNARNASWSTTILALNTEAGQVVSHTHPDIPGRHGICSVSGSTATWASGDPWTHGGSSIGDVELINKHIVISGREVAITAISSDGSTITTTPDAPAGTGPFQVITADFRIQKWTLYKDWRIEIQGKTVTASMYDLDVGPKPIDVRPEPLPAVFYPIPIGQAWFPNKVHADTTDALYPFEKTFDLSQASGEVTATGMLPVDSFIPGCGPPAIDAGAVTVLSTGGTIPGGVTLRIAVCVTDAKIRMSPPSNIILVQIPTGTNTNSITVSGIQWPPVTGLEDWALFASAFDTTLSLQLADLLTAGSPATTYTPTSLTLTALKDHQNIGLPNPNIVAVRVKAKRLFQGGVLGAAVDSVTSTTIVSGGAVDASSTDNWTGRVLALIGRDGGATPWRHFTITSFAPTTGTFTVDRDPGMAGVVAGDAIVVCFKGSDNSADPYKFTDAGLASSHGAGLTPHDPKLQGAILTVIGGLGRGFRAKVVDNDATSYQTDVPLLMDATTVWVVGVGNWEFSVDSADVDNANYQLPTSVILPTSVDAGTTLLVAGFTVDDQGNESGEDTAPMRMVYVFQSPGGGGSTDTVYAEF